MNIFFKRSCFLLFDLFILSLSSYGQLSISGKITDRHQIPVSNSILLVLNNVDSTLIQTVLTDSAGNYHVSIPIKSAISLKATAMGYKDSTQEISNPEIKETMIDFVLQQDFDPLTEVVVTASKPLVERKIDRTIFNVSGSIGALGNNALAMMKKAPGVLIKQSDNSIQLIGKSGVQIMINNKLLQLVGEDLFAFLEAMPAESIERIEVITTPPAKYDAAGNSGLINIILKKNSKKGFIGNARLGYEQASYAKGIFGTDLHYGSEKLDVHGNASYANGANQIVERLRTPYPEQIFAVTDDYKRTLKPLQFSLGADYEWNERNSFGIQLLSNYMNRRNDANSGIDIYHLPTLTLDSTMLTTSLSTVKNDNNILNLNYVKTIDTTGRKITVNFNQLWFNSRRINNFETTNYLDNYLTPSNTSTQNKSNGNQDINISAIQADIELPYKWANVSMGGKWSITKNVSNNHFGFIGTDGYHEDHAISNAFDYSEHVQALYFSAEKTMGKWSMNGGLRGEFTQTKGYSNNLNQTNKNQYFKLFPTAYIQYAFNENNVLNINYSKRINRPDYRSLDPFRAYATPYHYNQGNPFLQPSINHNLELSYTFKNKYTFTAFYQKEINHFSSVWMIDTLQNITSGISLNFADYMAYGVNATTSVQPLPQWEMQGQYSIQRQVLASNIYSNFQQSYNIWIYYIGFNNSFIINKSKTLFAEINMYYLSKQREDFLEIKPLGSLDIGLKALFCKQKVVLAINATDVLATQKARGIHIVSGQTINNYFDTKNIRFSLQYKFGNNKMKAKQTRNTGIEEENSRVR